MAAATLTKLVSEAQGHVASICEFSLNRPPMRAKVDRQSYDELKPGVDRALAVFDWFTALQSAFVSYLGELAQSERDPSPDALALIAQSLDVIIVLENQFAGWSACINRFSWFKRTFAQVRREVAKEINADKLQQEISKFQAFIGDAMFPMGTHMTGPLRQKVKKVRGHERPLVAAVFALSEQAASSKDAPPMLLRPMPFLLYLADGDAGEAYNVFLASKLLPVQKVFKRYPIVACNPPDGVISSLQLPDDHQQYRVHLGTVLSRCPHWSVAMNTKWGMPKAPGEESCCVVL